MSDSAYTRKLSEAQQVVAEHNSNLGDDSESHISWDNILAKLKRMGGTTDQNLRQMTWEDLEDCGVPRILARTIVNGIFRKNGDEASKPRILTANRVAAMSFVELFKNYDPTGETNPAVRDRLATECDGKRCVVFDPRDNTTILADESAKRLREIKDGLGDIDVTQVNGVPCPVYYIGERPDTEPIEENFLYPGEMLRNGICTRTNRDVSGVPVVARQIVYLAITDTNELSINSVEDAQRVLDTLDCDDPVGKAQARYSRAAILLQEKTRAGEEPRLRVPKGGRTKANNPFTVGKHYQS
jgi:hypothetical protein